MPHKFPAPKCIKSKLFLFILFFICLIFFGTQAVLALWCDWTSLSWCLGCQISKAILWRQKARTPLMPGYVVYSLMKSDSTKIQSGKSLSRSLFLRINCPCVLIDMHGVWDQYGGTWKGTEYPLPIFMRDLKLMKLNAKCSRSEDEPEVVPAVFERETLTGGCRSIDLGPQ